MAAAAAMHHKVFHSVKTPLGGTSDVVVIDSLDDAVCYANMASQTADANALGARHIAVYPPVLVKAQRAPMLSTTVGGPR